MATNAQMVTNENFNYKRIDKTDLIGWFFTAEFNDFEGLRFCFQKNSNKKALQIGIYKAVMRYLIS